MRRALPRLLLLLSFGLLTACATVEGAGQDISDAGDFVSDSAREVRRAF